MTFRLSLKKTSLLAAAAMLFSCQDQGRGDSAEHLQLTLLGQSLVRYDPRKYMEEPSGRVKALLSGSDIVFTNLECAVCVDSSLCMPTRTGPENPSFPSPPEVLDYLMSLHVNLLSLSNNHSWDFGDEGILSTIREVRKRGFAFAGTGANLKDAVSPAMISAKGKKVALLAMSSASKFRALAAATEDKPGVNIVDMKSREDKARILAELKKIRKESDIVIVYQHLQGLGTVEEQEAWARELADHGATFFVSHGDPRLYGIELYKESVLFYGLGNFIFHTRAETGHYEPEVWQSVVVNVDYAGDKIASVDLYPVAINEKGQPGDLFLQTRGIPEMAGDSVAHKILSDVAGLSARYGTRLKVENGKASLLMNGH